MREDRRLKKRSTKKKEKKSQVDVRVCESKPESVQEYVIGHRKVLVQIIKKEASLKHNK